MLIARLRSGHHPALRVYLHRLDPDIDPVCPTCKEDHTLHHWLTTCPHGDRQRQNVFGCPGGRLEWLTACPKAVVAYARKTLVDLDV